MNIRHYLCALLCLLSAAGCSDEKTPSLDYTAIDELIADGYNPILDDGVGKNIAPLQKKGMLKAEVLKANQLVKYLNADW